MIEGVSLFNENINPYDGDLFHETPLALVFFSHLTSTLSDFYVSLVFITCDLCTAFVLYYTSKLYTDNLVCKRRNIILSNFGFYYIFFLFQLKRQANTIRIYNKEFNKLLIPDEFSILNPVYVCSVYMLNPYTVFSCIARTTTVFNNLFLALCLYAMVKRKSELLIFFTKMSSL